MEEFTLLEFPGRGEATALEHSWVTSNTRGAEGAHTQAGVQREVGTTAFILSIPYEKC